MKMNIKPQKISSQNKFTKNLTKFSISLKVVLSLVSYLTRRDYKVYLDILSRYGSQMEFNIIHQGPHHTVEKYKLYFQYAVRLALRLPTEAIPFTRITKCGHPLPLKPILPLLKGDYWDRRIGLTIARCYTLIKLEPTVDVSQVVTPGKEISLDYLNKWKSFVGKILKPIDHPKYPVPQTFTFGARTGPNGPAVLTAHLDAIALKRSPLFDTFMEIAQTVEFPLLSSLSTCLTYQTTEKLSVGKISFIPEKGGKTRLIAIADFWSQQLLKGFHNSLIEIIVKTMGITDSTFDQNKAFKRAMYESKGKKVYSFDLKNATDRFPYLLQKEVLISLWGHLGELVGRLLVERDFKVKGLEHPIRWVVGQPLGSYSSWPLFTLSHHLIVRYSASLVGKQDFTSYQLLGDDIIIWDETVAESYQSVMSDLGVTMSSSKTVISECPDNSVGEFAKRIFQNGIEISPLSPTLIIMSDSLYAMPAIIRELSEKWQVVEALSERLALELYGKKGKEILSILLGCGHLLRGMYPFHWCHLNSEPGTLLKGLTRYLDKVQTNTLFNRNPKSRKAVLLPDLKGEFLKLGLVVPDSLLNPGYDGDDPHPIVLALAPMKEQVREQWSVENNWLTISIFDSIATRAVVDPGLPKAIKDQRHLRREDLSLYFYNDRRGVLPKLALDYYYKLVDGTEKLPLIEYTLENFRKKV
jgi:hypothetical protein